jgi:hypothetical protein
MTLKGYAVSLTVPEKDIYYISWNLDACDGLGFLCTDDPKNGKVTVITSHELMNDLYDFIKGLCSEGIEITIDSVGEE